MSGWPIQDETQTPVINRNHDRHSGRSVFGPIRNPEVIYIEIPGSRFAPPGMTASKGTPP
jgi:hypothetical protein